MSLAFWFGDPLQDASAAVGWFALLLIAAIVGIDATRLLRMGSQVPILGDLPRGGWAWESDGEGEWRRHWSHLLALAVMMVVPWAMQDLFSIPTGQIVILDLLLIGMAALQVAPKRYAVTSQHLYADGFRYEWSRLRHSGWKGESRIVLHRLGWGPFAPLPLGGSRPDLEQVALRVEAALSGRWDEIIDLIAEE